MRKNLIILIILLTIVLTGCANTDVLRKYSEKSFKQITTNFKDIITEENDRSILTIDGKNRLIVQKNFATNEDIIFELEASPFINAGLNNQNIPDGYKLENGKLIMVTDFGIGQKSDFISAFFLAIDNQRDKLVYHKDLDHYGLKLASGDKFEFARDCKTNDKDLVFVLSAKAFADKGIRVNQIDGWIFKTMKQDDGSELDVLLKPYDMEMSD